MEPLALFAVTARGVFWLTVDIGLAVLTLIASVKIIAKAGYSGWWITVPSAAVVFSITSQILTLNSLDTIIQSPFVPGSTPFPTTEIRVAHILFRLAEVCFLASWAFFLFLGFADWPALRHQATARASAVGRSRDPLPFSPGPGDAPGWYQVGATNNDQAYWDGQGWTARKHWEGAGWVDVPVVRPHPEV
jgi:hypothetical protein